MLVQFRSIVIVALLCLQYFLSSVLTEQICWANLVEPFVIPVQNVTNFGITARGISLSVGTPLQALTFIAHGYDLETDNP